MLRPDQVKEVRRLLARGKISQREIARELRLARGTVAAIAHGRRPDYSVKPPDEDQIRPLRPPVRCAGCGGMVYAPCRLCRVRAVQARELLLVRLRRSDAYRAAG